MPAFQPVSIYLPRLSRVCITFWVHKIPNSKMSDSNGNKPVLLARLDFPPYCMKVVSERHILVAGGGGSSKTGVPNCIDIYELIYDPVANTGRLNLATRFDNGL